jgi:hypothetical protein
MTGTWSWSIRSCTDANDDGRLQIRWRSVEFFASSYSLQTIATQPNRTIRATAIVHEEGEEGSTQGAIQLKLIAANRLRIHTDGGLAHVYVRCNERRRR